MSHIAVPPRRGMNGVIPFGYGRRYPAARGDGCSQEDRYKPPAASQPCQEISCCRTAAYALYDASLRHRLRQYNFGA